MLGLVGNQKAQFGLFTSMAIVELTKLKTQELLSLYCIVCLNNSKEDIISTLKETNKKHKHTNIILATVVDTASVS